MVKTKNGNFEVRSITFGERRELHRLEMKTFWDESLDQDAYFELLDWVMKKHLLTQKKLCKNLMMLKSMKY